MKSIFLLGACLVAMAAAPAAAQTPPRPEAWTTLRETAPLPPVKKTGRLSVTGAELHYAVYGAGAPIILLHPGLGNSDYWANQIGPLSQDFEVTVVDLRGHGRSTGAGGPITYAMMAQDVVSLIKTLKLKEPTVIGWGDGAVVGLEIARLYPKRIGQLVAFGLVFDRSGLQPAPDRSATFVGYVQKALADYQRLAANPEGFAALLDQMELLWEREPNFTAKDLAKIRTPTVIVAAEYDEWVKLAHMQQAAEFIPGARFVSIPKASHFAPWQAPRKFNDGLRLVLTPAKP